MTGPHRGTVSSGGRHVWETGWGWQPLWLDTSEVLVAGAEDFGVPVRSASLLGDGMLNQTWRLRCDDHDRTLRVSRSERTVEQVAYEHRFTTVVASAAPVVVAETEHVPIRSGHALSLYPFVTGRSGTVVASVTRSRRAVAAAARMHRAALADPLPQRPGFVGMDEHHDWWGWETLRRELSRDMDDELRRAIDTVAVAIDELSSWLDGLRQSGRLDLRACVHGDLNPRNLLFGPGTELTAIIDVDDCRVEPLVWEVAQQAYSSPEVDPHAVWRTYQDAGGPLPDADEDLLSGFARLGALSDLDWFVEDGSPTHLARGGVIDVARQLTGGIARDS